MRAMPKAATRQPTIALAAALSCTIVAHQPGSVRAATDGFVTREEALRIVQTPLENTIGRAEADRVQRVAVANALLEHCRLDWERLFRALTAYHRHRRGRSETEMSRITVWHGAWQGQALAMLRRDRPGCDETMRRAALGNAARQLQALAPGSDT
jgi:hypothetical protein